MKTPSPIPAIWVLFTPYLVTWVQNEYGTGIKVSGRTLLELRPIPGIREVLRKAVVEDVGLNMKITNSMSQQRFELFRMASGLQSIKAKEYVPEEKKIDAFLPVHVPPYLLTKDGVLRPFSKEMMLQHEVAANIGSKVYNAFWMAVHHFAQDGSYAIDRDMLESFCEENGLGDITIDDLRNQYQRMKRNYFFNKS